MHIVALFHIFTLCTYVQQGYVFSRIGLYVYMYYVLCIIFFMYVNEKAL